MPIAIPKKNKELFRDEEWPDAFPHGKEALRKALKKAARAGIFDVEESGDQPLIPNKK